MVAIDDFSRLGASIYATATAPDQAEVALRISRGLCQRQIADEMSVSYQIVRTHLQHVYNRAP